MNSETTINALEREESLVPILNFSEAIHHNLLFCGVHPSGLLSLKCVCVCVCERERERYIERERESVCVCVCLTVHARRN